MHTPIIKAEHYPCKIGSVSLTGSIQLHQPASLHRKLSSQYPCAMKYSEGARVPLKGSKFSGSESNDADEGLYHNPE